VMSEKQNVSAAEASTDSAVKMGHVSSDPSSHGEAQTSSETVEDFSQNVDTRTLDDKAAAVQSTAVLHHDDVVSDGFEALPTDVVKMKYVVGDIIPAESASRRLECIAGSAVVHQQDVSVKTEPVHMDLTTSDSLQHGLTDTTVAMSQHEAQCTDAVLQHDSVSTNDEFTPVASPAVDRLREAASADGSVLRNEAASNDSALKLANVGDNSGLQREVQIRDGNMGLDEREFNDGTVRSSVEFCDKDRVDSLSSTAECNEVSSQETVTAATSADVSTADVRLEDAVRVDRDATDDSASLDLVSDSSADSPAGCDEAEKTDDFVTANSSPLTIAHGSDTLLICSSQDVADQDAPSACIEMTDECSSTDKEGSVSSFLLVI